MKVRAKTTVHDRLLDESEHRRLTAGRTYTVIEIDDENFRVINDGNEPILYQKGLFDVLDDSIPAGWIKETFEDDEYFMGPPELSRKGFYEAYFDRKPEAVAQFESMRVEIESW